MKPAFRYHSCWSQTRLSSIGQYLKSLAITIFGKHSGSNGFINYVTVAMLSYTLFLWQFGGQRVYCLCLFDEELISSLVFVSSKSCQYASSQLLVWIDLKVHYDGCGSGGRGVRLRSWNVGGTPTACRRVLGQDTVLNPKLLPMAHPSVCECSGE